jgi:putative sensory transduction regulator
MASDQVGAAIAAVDEFLAALDTDVNNPAPGEWGVVLEAAGYRLDVGVAIRAQHLRAQAAVLPAEVIDPHQLLYWNRQAPFVSFAENKAGEVFVCGELPLESLTTETLDRFLGLLLASATRAREFAIESR